jgi:methionyl-tRNA formyltransferase
MLKVLLIGFSDCEYCTKASDFLDRSGFDVTNYWSTKSRGKKIPDSVLSWSGDYIIHLKSYHILPEVLIKRAHLGAINFHPSPPWYPGSGGINKGLYNLDKKSGITLHYMDEKVDNGKIIKFFPVDILETDTVETLLKRVHSKQFFAFMETVISIGTNPNCLSSMSDEYKGEPWGSHTGKIREIDEMENIDLDITKEELQRIIRATHFNGFGPKITIHGNVFKYIGENK